MTDSLRAEPLPEYELHEMLESLRRGPCLYSEGEHSVLRAEGRDVLDLLHRLSTNAVAGLHAGEAAETILTSEKGKVIDVLLVLVRERDCLLICSGKQVKRVREWLENFTIMEDARFEDVTSLYGVLEILGNGLDRFSAGLLNEKIATWKWVEAKVEGMDILVCRHESVTGPGFRILYPRNRSGEILNEFHENRIPSINREAYEIRRVQLGLPALDREIMGDVNPLECGAEKDVSWSKGCYVGQEVIARLNSYDKVQRAVKRVRFVNAPPERVSLPVELRVEEKEAGRLTTVVYDPHCEKYEGLGLVRVAFSAPGTVLEARCGEKICKVEIVREIADA